MLLQKWRTWRTELMGHANEVRAAIAQSSADDLHTLCELASDVAPEDGSVVDFLMEQLGNVSDGVGFRDSSCSFCNAYPSLVCGFPLLHCGVLCHNRTCCFACFISFHVL